MTDRFELVNGAFAARDVFSKQASESSRKLDFVGYGLIALFAGLKSDDFSFPLHLPNRLVWAGLLLTLALGADLIQSVYGSVAFATFGRTWEKRLQKDEAKTPPDGYPSWINWPTNVFFWGKLILTGTAWVLLLLHLWRNLR